MPSLANWAAALLIALAASGCGHKAQVAMPQPPRQTAPSAPTRSRPQPTQPEVLPAPKTKVPEIAPPPGLATALPTPIPSVSSTVPPSPPIRIGLNTAAREVRISVPGEFYLVEKKPEAPRELISGEVRVRVEQEVEESSEVFRVQLAALSSAEAADGLRRELELRFSKPVVVHENVSGLKQVRLGAFSTREEALKFANGALAGAGYRDFLVVRETTATGGGEARLALRGPQDLFRISKTGFLFFPGSLPIQLDGKPYRGFLDLSLNSSGRITAVNQLGMEEYLLGVIPAEMSPTTYPEFAALTAQSIAARTYALKNMGKFRSEGFDLTADIRTQVYAGLSGENEAANEAVRQTFGVAIYYQGKLIDAMYSSTCGGRTEDFAKVFDGPDVPYLKSVVCAVENSAELGIDVELAGKHDWNQSLFTDDGGLANRSLELARVLGLLPAPASAGYLAQTPDAGEVRRWIDQVLAIAKKTGPVARPEQDITTRAGFIQCAAESFFGTSEIGRRISPADAGYYIGNLRDGSEVPRSARLAFAYLIQAGLWHPYPDNSAKPKEPIRRGDGLSLLMRWIESAQAEILRTGVFVGQGAPTAGAAAAAAAISIKSGRQTMQLTLSEDMRLYRIADGRSIPVDSIKVIGNEKLGYHISQDGKIDFLEVELNPTGASSDRFSPVASWQTTLSRAAIAEKLRSLAGGVGEFRDMKPSRLGSSGRAVQIQVIGTRGSAFLNGYKVRNALGLKDTLFTLERSKNADGSVETFTFRGRGWGHGVGMCQVGAYGMARAGRSFEEILKTYYTGVEIKKAY